MSRRNRRPPGPAAGRRPPLDPQEIVLGVDPAVATQPASLPLHRRAASSTTGVVAGAVVAAETGHR